MNKTENQNINIKNWQQYSFADIFDIEKGFYNNRPEQDEKEKIPFVSASKYNNGITDYVNKNNTKIFKANAITVVNDGNSMAHTFYQDKDFTSSHSVNILRIKKDFDVGLTENIAMFLNTIIYRERDRFSYGRKWRFERMLKTPIKLPSKNGKPDWQFMENYIEKIKSKIKYPTKDPVLDTKRELKTKNWKSFNLTDLFKISGSETTPLLELEEYGRGNYPYVTTQATNNGVEGFYNFYTEDGGVLTVDSAVLGYCSYQSYNFSASDHVEKLIPKFMMNKYIAMFLVTIINQEQYRYNYGRKCSQDRMEKGSIKLPSKDGSPDWGFMENYIKSLSYSSNL
ncbi:hypothetical protein COY31_01610 [Candidatus Wolfebacteria bacterium CG_4_10_14_0_2_um_filter_39_18]|uniref:Type I restriction modification DNA specificity domain-containing protein n=1 Tax=Candidatus Wolfebacteria bacterium CG_4_10_14_0_2_um_filter_39_18 TaxID=1975061 RepID=A0A2M7TFW2_9BACT|nr:MAG: hypothetical protein COY31_01610 [Candidatus Wolfebacteria bacterium CG_4_10_14_0_2_um_filter_39_18]